MYPTQVSAPPGAGLALVVAIPCYDEPGLGTTLKALWDCERPPCEVEVLTVINSSERDPPEVLARNRETYRSATRWIARHDDPRLRFHLLEFPHLPRRHAGVGLARKLGMDEAVSRLARNIAGRGIVASLDADCRCAPNYLTAIHQHFSDSPGIHGASIYFEHPLDDAAALGTERVIARYELFLRYYTRALRYAGLPHAFHTVGSCTAVRSEVYAAQGGMNRRQAGEDFYFVLKLALLGGWSELLETTVYPSPRISHRTPFGTGNAVREWAGAERPQQAYAPEAFRDLRQLFLQVPALYRVDPDDPGLLGSCPAPLRDYLLAVGFRDRLREVQRNAASPASFENRLWRWLNAFRVMKFLNATAGRDYPRVSVEQAARELLRWCRIPDSSGTGVDGTIPVDRDLVSLLMTYRALDRAGPGA